MSRISQYRGLFGTLARAAGAWELEAGLRYNRVNMDAGEISGDMAIMPGSPMFIQQVRLDELAAAFNAAVNSASMGL